MMIVGELEQFVRWAKSLDGPYTPPNGPYQPFPFFPIPNPGVVNPKPGSDKDMPTPGPEIRILLTPPRG